VGGWLAVVCLHDAFISGVLSQPWIGHFSPHNWNCTTLMKRFGIIYRSCGIIKARRTSPPITRNTSPPIKIHKDPFGKYAPVMEVFFWDTPSRPTDRNEFLRWAFPHADSQISNAALRKLLNASIIHRSLLFSVLQPVWSVFMLRKPSFLRCRQLNYTVRGKFLRVWLHRDGEGSWRVGVLQEWECAGSGSRRFWDRFPPKIFP
jgi:hypothetical protein